MRRKLTRKKRPTVVMNMAPSKVAHAVRNSLGAMILNAEMLSDELKKYKEADTRKARSLINSIMHGIEKLNGIVEEFLREKGRAGGRH